MSDLFRALDKAESFMRVALANLHNRAIQENRKNWEAALADIQGALTEHAPPGSAWDEVKADQMASARKIAEEDEKEEALANGQFGVGA